MPGSWECHLQTGKYDAQWSKLILLFPVVYFFICSKYNNQTNLLIITHHTVLYIFSGHDYNIILYYNFWCLWSNARTLFFCQIRTEVEQHMNCNLKEYKEFIDNEMLLILGQMDKATLIFDHVYLVGQLITSLTFTKTSVTSVVSCE